MSSATVMVQPVSEWPRDQPTITRLTRRGSEVLVQTRTSDHFIVNVQVGTAKRFVFESCGSAKLSFVLDDAVICHDETKRTLWRRDAGQWRQWDLPASLKAADVHVAAAQRGDTLALLDAKQLHLLQDARWQSHNIGPAPKGSGTMGLPTRLMFHGDRLLAGYDRGEWGGGLFQIKLDKPSWQKLELPNGGPLIGVRDLVVAADGSAIAVFGLAHLSLREGLVATIGESQLTPVVANGDTGFQWPKASFQAAAYDAGGVLHILTSSFGLVAHKQGRWAHVTSTWTDQFAYMSDVVIVGDTAVIASYDAGIALWPLDKKGPVRRLALPSM